MSQYLGNYESVLHIEWIWKVNPLESLIGCLWSPSWFFVNTNTRLSTYDILIYKVSLWIGFCLYWRWKIWRHDGCHNIGRKMLTLPKHLITILILWEWIFFIVILQILCAIKVTLYVIQLPDREYNVTYGKIKPILLICIRPPYWIKMDVIVVLSNKRLKKQKRPCWSFIKPGLNFCVLFFTKHRLGLFKLIFDTMLNILEVPGVFLILIQLSYYFLKKTLKYG